MIISKVILLTSFICYVLLNVSQQAIISVPLQTDLNDLSYSDCVQSQQDSRPRIGYYLNSLLNIINSGQYVYQAFSATIWLKPKFKKPSQMKNYFGIYNDITSNLGNNSNGFCLYSDEVDSFRFTADYFGISQPRQNEISPLYNSTWYKAIILYQPLNKIGYARVADYQNNVLFTQSLDFSNLQTYFIHYQPGTSNINDNAWLSFNHGVSTNFNSCSKQKYAMFHYSNDETFSLDDIQAAIFDNYLNYKGYIPIYYFPLKVNNKYSSNKVLLQRFKNIYAPNTSEAINGQTYLQDSSDIQMSANGLFYIASFTSGKYVQLKISLSPYQFMISFILYYQSITSNGIIFLTTDSNSFSIKVIQSSQPQLQIILADSSVYSFNLGQSGSRHTIAFSLIGPTLLSSVAYYVNSNLQGTIQLNSQLGAFSKVFLGSQSQIIDSFQIQDLYFIPNSDLKASFPTEPTFAPQNCNLFYSFNLNISYCLTCVLTQQYSNYYGQCTETLMSLSIEGILFYYSYSGTNFISLIDASSDLTSSPLTYNYQISNNQFDFLILGYYQITQWQSGQLFTSLAYLQVDQTVSYYILNLYLESPTKVTLKLTLDSANLICSQSIYYQSSLLNQWIFLGFGYKTSTQQAYLVYQDKYGITQSKILSCQGQIIRTDIKSFTICLGCLIPNTNKYTQFIGKAKNIKLIEGFNDYANINQYIYFDQDNMELSARNINYFQMYSLKYLFAYSLPDLVFACQTGYYFLEGICVSSCSNVVRSQTSLGTYNPLYANSTTYSCEICPQNCLICFSPLICNSCRAGFVVDQNSKLCISCSQGTFYDVVTQQCVSTCTRIADLMNQLCVTNIDSSVLNSLLFFNSQILSQNEGFQIINNSNVLQQDKYAKCQGNNPYSFFMFYGGESLLSSFAIQKTWSNLPNNYAKIITFTVVLFNFSSLDDLQVNLNGKVGSLTNGPNSWNCITCQRLNNIVSTQQCVCGINEYYKSNLCYSSPCYSCSQCSIQNCLRCQDETGKCLICNQGYSLLQGNCVQSCSQQQFYSSYTINPQFSYCYQQNSLAFDHFQPNKILNNLEFWQLSVDYVGQSGLISCLNQYFLPNLGNSNGVQDSITLQIILNQFQSKYRGILFDINLLVIDNITLNQDYILFQFAGSEVKRVTYKGKPAPTSTCINPNYQEQFQEVIIPIYKGDGQINLNIQSLFKDSKLNESFTLGEVKAYYIINEPLCTKYNFGQNYSSSVCSSCATYSSMGLNNQCFCNDGYFFFYNQNNLDGVCVQCNPLCSKCFGPSVYDCSQCQSNFFYQQATSLCVTTCETNEFIFVNTKLSQNECQKCDNSCLTCTGPNKTDCLTCSNNFYLDSSSYLCVAKCQSNQYQSKNKNTGQIWCMPCNQECLSCQGPQKTDCITCSNNYYLDNVSNLCVEYCQSNQYQKQNTDTGQIVCLNCDQACLTCQDGSQKDCITCSNMFYLDNLSNLCVQQCQPNQYQSQNPISGQIMCMSCDQTCLSCSNQGRCLTCAQGQFLYNNQCVLACPNNYQINQNTNTCDLCTNYLETNCQTCDITCRQCIYGKTDNNSCTSCYETKQLIGQQCQCNNKQDNRNNYFQCSYLNVAVLDIYLSSNQPLLTIEFGSPLQIIDQYSIPSQIFCTIIFQESTKILIGTQSTCSISGSQILVNLGNDSIIMENNEIKLNSNILRFQGYKVQINTYYKKIVQQQYPGKSQLILSYNNIQNSCNDTTINFKQFINDAQRGLLSINWSIVSFSKAPTLQNQQTINNILQKASDNIQTTLIITKQLIPVDSTLTLSVAYTFKVNQQNFQTLQIQYSDKQILVQYIQSIQPPFLRYMGISYSFTFLTQICDDNRLFMEQIPTDIKVISSNEIKYIQKDIQNYPGQNLQIDILQYTLPSNQLSFFNVSFSLSQSPNIMTNVSMPLQSSSSDQLFTIDLANQIGEIIINSTMIENQGSIYLQGRDQSVLADRITEKYLFNYAKMLLQSDTNQTQSYSVLYNILSQNIYYNTKEFQSYIQNLQQQIPDIKVSNNEVITPRIKNIQSQNMLNSSMIKYQFNTYNSNSNYNLTCIQKQNNNWQPNQCQAKKNSYDNSYTCVCQTQSPTTLVEQLEDVILNNQNLKTAFGSEGLDNITKFTEPYKYTSFWLLTTITFLQFILWYIGTKLDKKSLDQKLFKVSPFNQIQTNHRGSIDQLVLSHANSTRRKRRQRMSILQSKQMSNLQNSQRVETRKKRTFELQITETENPFVENQQIQQNENTDVMKIFKADSYPFKLQNQFSQESQEENNNMRLFKKVDSNIFNQNDIPMANKLKIENLDTLTDGQVLNEVATPQANQINQNKDRIQLIKNFERDPVTAKQSSNAKNQKSYFKNVSQFQNQTSNKNQIQSIKDLEENMRRQESFKEENIKSCNQKIISISLESDLIDSNSSNCLKGSQDYRSFIGYTLNSLLGVTTPGQYNYQAFSASIWFKPKYAQSDWSNNFGILSDITARLFDNRNGFTLNNVNSLKIFSLQAGYFGTSQINKETQYYQSFYNKVWIKGIILYQPLNKIGYARVLDAQNNLLFETSMDFSNLQTYFMHYIPGTQNINNNVWLTFQHGVYYNYNSCSKQKYAMFHYSNDEAFSVSQIQVQAFDNYINYNINFPVSYFPLKRQVNNLINNQIISFQRYKNIYSPNLSEAINGQNYLQDGQDINFVLNNGEYIADFNSGQYVQYPTSLSPYQFMISYIFYYNQITANGITLFTTDTNSFTIQVIQTSQLQITLSGNPNKYAFNLAQNGTRHTIAFSVYGPKLLTKITYYQNNITVSSQKLSSLLNSFSKIYIGGQQQPNDRFQIQDLYLIPNSEFQVNYTTEPALVPKNCSFFYSFNLNLSNCFSCQANYQLNYYGQCVQVFQQSQIQQMPFTYSYFGSNFISIVDVPSDPTNKQLIYNYQISNNQFDFLILGYYQINQWQIGQLFTSLAYLQVLQTNQYYFLNIYLESLTKMTLKLTLDQANLICYQSIIYENSVLNQWILVGFGYKTSTLSAYLVYQDKYGITKYQMLSCSGQSVGADTNSFQVCIGCLIANNNKYSQFIGKVKNIKLIEGFSDYPNINQYIYFDQDAMDLSANNINYLKVYSLKDLFTYSLPGMQFACTNGYYFLEGICVSSCTNVIRSQTSLGSYSPLYTNNDTLSCEICPQNCLTCSSSSICTSCKPGFVVDQNSNLCISCSQNTFYDTISHLCVQKCTNIADLMNMQCVIQSDPSILNSFLFFSSQILTYNEGFQILDSNSILQQDTFSKCQGNNPYSFFMFYGGESVSSTQTIQKVWQNLPNNYSKQIKFTVVLFNFSSLADLQVLLNGQIASQTSMILINQNNNICIPNSQTQTQTIYQLSYDLTDNLNTLQLIIKYKQNGLGIRNIQLSVKKCHSSCNSCQNGPNPWNCITCQKNNNVINSSQCVCASSEYSQSNQCYSSPCLNCVQCSVQNCLRCQDETGDCIICNQGYSLLQGKCISSCSQQQNLSSYSVNSQISVCYLSKNLALDHFQNNKIINNLEFWQLSVDYVSQSGLINCLNQNFLPNLGNVNGVQDFIALQMPLNKFKSNYRGILFDINLVVIDNVTLNTDFIIFQFAGTEVKRVSYQGKSAPISTCINPNYQEQIQEILLPIYKPDGQIDLKIQSLFNDIKQNESFTLSEVKAYYIINEPLCTQYSFGQNYSSSQCSSCKTNSSMGLNNQCLCNDGYYFYYNPSNLDGECIQCNPVCSKCVGPSIYDCLVCSTNKYYSIFSKACVTQCLSNEFIFANSVLVQNECHQCDNSCLTCQGPNNTDCLTCKNSYYQDSVSKLCVAQCQSNQYQINNPSTGQIMCMPCDLTCLTCKNQGPDQCTACSQGKFLYSSYCLPACPNNYQTNQKTNTCDLCQKFIVPQCQACHITCKQCTYGKTDNNSCTSCYETKQLIDSQCKCKNTLDTRDQYFQCSYQNIAVLDIYLSSTDAILTIEFGSPLNTISNYNTPSSEFCNAIFDDKTQLLIGATSTCIISGSQILVNLGNDSTVMENNELTLRGNVLSFKDQTSLITAFYKTTVSQQYPGVSQLIFNYKNIQNSCDDITINFSQIINDAKRGLLSITWSIVSYSTPPSQETLETINQILQLANQNKYTTLKIIKYLAPVDSTLKIQVAYKFKVNQNNVQTFLVYYQMDKSIQVQQMQSIQPPFYRYMSISYTFIFSTQICNNKGPQIQSFPMNIQITPSQELQYLQNTLQSYQGQNLEIDILQYTLPSNKLSFLNVTFSLSEYANVTSKISIPIQVLASPIFVKINNTINVLPFSSDPSFITSFVNYSSSDQFYQIYLSNQIGEMIINSTMIENQGSIQLQGKEQTILVDRITKKNLNNYAKTSQQSTTNQTQSYSVMYSTLSQNIYYNKTSFQDQVNKIKKFYPNITVSNNQVISPKIKSIKDQNMLNNSIFFFEFNNSKSYDNFNMTCIQYLNEKWQSNQCQSKKLKFSNNYSCLCQNQSPTTLIEQIEDALLDNQNLNTAFGSQGWFNLTNSKDPYKNIALWILSITALFQLILWYFGRKLDQKSVQKKLFSVTPQIQVPVTLIQTPHSLNLMSPNRFTQNRQEQKIVLQTLEKDSVYSQQRKQKRKRLSLIQMKKVDNSPSTEQKIQQKIKIAHINNQRRDSLPFTYKTSSDNNEDLNINDDANKIKKIKIDSTPQINQKAGFTEKIEELQMLEANQVPTQSSSEKAFINEQNENSLKNQIEDVNSKQMKKGNQNFIRRGQNFDNFLSKNFFVRMMILHDFISIFFFYNEELSRPIRFQMVYMEKGILKAISTISKILIILIYNYIILSVISGSEPSEANQFLELFLIATGMDFVVYQCLMAIFKNILINIITSTNTTNCLILYIFNKLELQDMIEKL
ncbi:hypothetical protein ABPG74_007825 [Tetrahymena malaccensis]